MKNNYEWNNCTTMITTNKMFKLLSIVFNTRKQPYTNSANSFWHRSMSIVANCSLITRRRSEIACGFSTDIMSLKTPHKKKCIGVKSSESFDHSIAPYRPIHLPLKLMPTFKVGWSPILSKATVSWLLYLMKEGGTKHIEAPFFQW